MPCRMRWLRAGHAALSAVFAFAAIGCGGSPAGGSGSSGQGGAASGSASAASGSGSGSGTSDTGSTPGNPPAGSGNGSGASPPTQASPDGGAGGADAGTATPGDATAATGEGGAPPSDAGAGPYKGVANSACTDLPRLGVTWFYNWTLSASGCTSRPFVPMIWGHTGKEQSATGIASELAGVASGGYDVVLGFNEPDNSSQSNISVATAISLWPSLTAMSGVRVGSQRPRPTRPARHGLRTS